MAKRLETALSDLPVDRLVANLSTRVTFEAGLPLTWNDGAPTCYICAPTVAYADYALEELRNFDAAPRLKAALGSLVRLARPLLVASGLDRQVQPNNWLLSTNIWCGLDEREVAALTRDLVAREESRAIVWRSLNDVGDAATLALFGRLGYRLLPARQVYLYDCRKDLPPLRRDLKNDLRLMERGAFHFHGPETLVEADFARIADLYGQLYLEKYTPLNPDYTPAFMERMHRSGLVEFHVLRDEPGEMRGVIGLFAGADVLTAPVVGYDRTLPKEAGLYRHLVVFGMMEARRRRLLYNMSAGAALFKRTRGAVPAIEYTAAYVRHLPLAKRAATRMIEAILTRIGIPLMKRFEL